MKFLVNRFEEKLSKQTAITVHFFDEEPLTVRQIRYNQGGAVCYCMDGSTQGKQKIKNEWKPIECKEDCEYRIKTGQGKAMCNEEGTLKFMLPDICVDKIWYMKITSHTSIQTLRDYIDFQKHIGNSLIGDYVIFLKEVEHSVEGNKFKNKVLDIIRKEDFISNNQTISSNQIISQNQNNQTQLSTNQVKDVEKNTEILEVIASENNNNTQNNKIEAQVEQKVEDTTQKVETNEKKVTKRTTKTKKESKKEPLETQEDAELNAKFQNYHILIETKTKMLTKEGKPTEYVFATFTNTDDKTVEVIIPPKYAEELKQCDLGTSVLLDLQTKGDKTFTNSIEYIDKCIKNVAA